MATPSAPEPTLLETSQGVQSGKGGTTVAQWKLWASNHQLLTVSQEGQILMTFCDLQKAILRETLSVEDALQEFVARNASKPVLGQVEEHGPEDKLKAEAETGEKPKADTKPPKKDRRTNVWNDRMAAPIYDAANKIFAVPRGHMRMAAIVDAAEAIFCLLDYNFICQAAEIAIELNPPAAVKTNIRDAMRKCEQARTAMMKHNARIVMDIASEFARKSRISLDDLLQAGASGLIIAVDRYDPSITNKGQPLKLSTLATYWIKAKVGRYIDDNGSTIRMPVHIAGKANAVRAIIDKIMRERNLEDGDLVTDTEVAIELLLNDKVTLTKMREDHRQAEIEAAAARAKHLKDNPPPAAAKPKAKVPAEPKLDGQGQPMEMPDPVLDQFKKKVAAMAVTVRSIRNNQGIKSLNAPLGGESDMTHGDTIADTGTSGDAMRAGVENRTIMPAVREAISKMGLVEQLMCSVQYETPDEEERAAIAMQEADKHTERLTGVFQGILKQSARNPNRIPTEVYRLTAPTSETTEAV